ncbi:hypothetical protein SLE2022_100510 [Rubroshorea leprosula]
MDENSGDCKTWEEQIFWNHFQSVRFTQFLRDGFNYQLAIPEKFAKHFKKKLPDTVTLKGPSGFTWDVGLTKDEDTLFFDRGWSTFVRDHSLKKNDFLTFKYNGVSHFDVLMFDGLSLCEKASSYFVKKCVHTEHDSGSQTKRKVKDYLVEITHTSSEDDLERTPEKSEENDIDQVHLQQPVLSTPTNKKKWIGNSSRRPIQSKWKVGDKQVYRPAREFQVKHDSESENMFINGNLEHSPLQTSHGRLVTEDQKRNALLLGQSVVSSEGFLIVMKPTHVKRKYFMAIPVGWMSRFMALELQDVILRLNDNRWQTRFTYYTSRGYGGLTAGWRNFAMDNNLDEHDVCVFECANPASKPLILDVKIFPVLQAVLPLNEVAPG